MAELRGGDNLERFLANMARKLATGSGVKVGFLSSATYPNGTPVALVAAVQNWGAPSIGIPPRPFFSDMIRDKQREWPAATANLLKANGYDGAKTLRLVGEAVAGQLRQSIVDTSEPPLKPATIARKGFAKPLVDTGHLLNSVDYEVME